MYPGHQVSQRLCVLAIRQSSDHVSTVQAIRQPSDHVSRPPDNPVIMCPGHQGIPAIMCPGHQVSQRSCVLAKNQRSCVLAIRYPSDHVSWPSGISASKSRSHQVSQQPSSSLEIMCPGHQVSQRLCVPARKAAQRSGIMCPGHQAARLSDGLAFRQPSNQGAQR